MDKHNTRLDFFLELIDAGYKNALVSINESFTKDNSPIKIIEICLPNVGTLRLYQTFEDVVDVQIPNFHVFYSMAGSENVRTKILNPKLRKRAIQTIYTAQKYFENHPEHVVIGEQDLITRLKHNKQMAKFLYYQHLKKTNRFLKSFEKQK